MGRNIPIRVVALTEKVAESIFDAGYLDYLDSPPVTLDALEVVLGDDNGLES